METMEAMKITKVMEIMEAMEITVVKRLKIVWQAKSVAEIQVSRTLNL